MRYEILFNIETVLQAIIIFIGLIMIKKYIFLEPGFDKGRNMKFYLVGFIVYMISFFVIADASLFVALILIGINVFCVNKNKRIRRILQIIPMIGYMNGCILPLVLVPVIALSMSEEKMVIHYLIVYSIFLLAIALFYFKGKKWRENFEKELSNRYLQEWERGLLCVVGIILIIYSNIINTIPSEELVDKIVVNDMVVHMVFTAIVVVILTITVIVLVMQGNKRSFYYKRVNNMSMQMVQALANTIDAKDSYTNGHSTRVAKYSVMLAQKMGYKEEKIENLMYAALLHDIGKIGIPKEIINKPSRLTDEEYEIIKTHPGIGANILKEITELPDITIGARWHHERYDGKGYPDKLSGTDIPELARIIGVADAYDAMTSKRSYRDVLSQEIVKNEIEKGKGTQFDPEIAEIMLELIAEDVDYTMHE